MVRKSLCYHCLFLVQVKQSHWLYLIKKIIKLEKKIVDNKTEGIFILLEKCLSKFNIKKFSNIYFSTGPGSFTALRSIKAISQALALSSNSKLLTASSFAPLLSSVQTNEKSFSLL